MYKQIEIEKQKYEINNKLLNNISNKISNIRLSLFILIIVCLFALKNYPTINIISTTSLVTIFIIIIIYHNKISKQIKDNDMYLKIISEYIDRRSDKWKKFSKTGEDILSNDLAIDLDLVGKNSLFQLINISKSINSQEALIKKLINPSKNKKSILDNQEAITELKNNLSFILNYQKEINCIKNIDNTNYQDNLNILNKEKHINKKELYFGITTATLTNIILILGIFNIINIRFFLLATIIQLIISYLYQFKYNEELKNISNSGRLLTDYKKIYTLLTNYNFKSKKLNNIKEDITKGKNTINKLSKIIILDSYRFNFITNIILNAIMSLNIITLYKYNNLINNNKKIFISNTNSFTELENLISLTTIPLIKDNVSLPFITNETSINFKDISHPLLDEKRCVKNDFSCKNDINIITGSNMSGKTSFMRTIAINLILMYNGTYVNALFFESSINQIFTSIRVTDDIDAGISTFYGELLRIEKILEYSKKHSDPIIVFIDEIFKGTNYKDRILGAKEIIKKLSKLNSIVLITTHDFELCEISNRKINNYHFEEQYNEDKISFDYKIKDGMCTKTNAKYLMELIGIIDK